MENQNSLINIIYIGYIRFIIFLFVIILTCFLFFFLITLNFPPKTVQSFLINHCLIFDNESELDITPLITPFNTIQSDSYASKSVYAKIIKENVFMYSQPVNNDFYKIFCVPRSYFVLLTDNANDAQNLFYKAIYSDLPVTGYMKKSDVSPVIGTPIHAFAQASFKTFNWPSLELKSFPNLSSEDIITVPFLNENLTYYGKAIGETIVPTLGNIWYYCKYTTENNIYYGYLYSAMCCDLSLIPDNEENLPEYLDELFPKETEAPPADNEIKLSNELKIIIIICACLPCLFIIYLLFKPTKLLIDNGKNQKKKMKRLKKSEYYEYDD